MKEATRVGGPWGKKPIYLGGDLPKVWWPWQQEVVTLLATKPDDRTCYWLYDKRGAFGKSKLAKYLGWKAGALYLSWSETKDAVYNVSKNMGKRIYLFDIPRTKPKLFSGDDLYSTIEQIKNGVVVNTKYDCSTQYMDPPWVIVFSNDLPNLACMSTDRWRVFELSGDPRTTALLPYVPPAQRQQASKKARLAAVQELVVNVDASDFL